MTGERPVNCISYFGAGPNGYVWSHRIEILFYYII